MKKFLAVILAAMMVFSILAVTVFADGEYDSPSKPDQNPVEVDISDDKGGTVIADPVTVVIGENTTLTAKIADGYVFTGWTIVGNFEWVQGDPNSLTIVIRPLGPIKAIANVKGAGGSGKDDGKKSPATGYNTEAVIVALASVLTVSAAAVAFTGKRYFCEK